MPFGTDDFDKKFRFPEPPPGAAPGGTATGGVDSGQAPGAALATVRQAVYCYAYTATAQSFDHNTETVVNYDTVSQDTHHGITTGAAWTYTVQESGVYTVACGACFAASTGWAVGEVARLILQVNGVLDVVIARTAPGDTSGTADSVYVGGAVSIFVVTGQTLAVSILQTSGGAQTLNTVARFNWIRIFRSA